MATANPSPSPAKPVSGGDPLAVVLGGALLVLFALWFGKDQPTASRTIVYGLLALGLGGVFYGLYMVLILRKAMRASDHAGIAGQRRMLGALLAVAGVALAAIACYLLWTLRKAAFGESVGLALFALVPLIAGLIYLKPETSSGELMQKVLRNIVFVQNILLLLGAVGMVVFLWLAFLKRNDPQAQQAVEFHIRWLPELAALLFQSLLCLTCGFWLISAQPAEKNEFSIRCLSLIFGGVTGFIGLVLAGTLTYVWRQDVVFGGVSVWQGENGYKFWICAYLGLAGLALMFSSLLLARSEVRSHPVLRQSLYGYNAIVTGLLLLVFLVTLNVVCYARFPMTFEWTRTRALTTLSKESKRMLSSLKEPTTVYVLLPDGHEILQDMESVLNNCQAQTDKLKWEHISPDTDAKAFSNLAMRFPELLPSALAMRRDETAGGRGLLIVYGALPTDFTKKVPHDFVPERKLSEKVPEFDRQNPNAKPKMSLTFKGEEELMSSLKHLVYGKENKKVYFLQDDDELDINVMQKRRHVNFSEPMSIFGAGNLVDRLKKDNYTVSGLSFRRKISDKTPNIVYVNESGLEKRYDVPQDAWVVVVAGASKEIPPEGLDALERFVEGKGKLLITVDVVAERSEQFPLKKSGLEQRLLKYGVSVEDNFVLRLVFGRDDGRPENDASLIVATVPDSADNELAKQFNRLAFQMRSVRVVQPAGKGGKYRAEKLLEVEPQPGALEYLEESSVKALQFPWPFLLELDKQHVLGKRLIKDAVPIAVTVTEGDKPKMVVFGDTDFLSNLGTTQSRDGDLNYSLFVSSLEWMAERQGLIGPQQRVTKSFSLKSGTEVGRMLFMPAWFMLIGATGLGIGIWLVRRR